MLEEIRTFRRLLKSKGLRHTPEREAIIREIMALKDHFDVETLYLGMKAKGVNVSKASIYRALPLLIESGLVSEVFHEEGHMHYELVYGRDHHCHLRCTSCKETIDFSDDRLLAIEEEIGREFGYHTGGHKLEIFGLCRACRKNAGKH